MASNTNIQPLTPEEEAKRQALNDRAAKLEQQKAEAARKETLAAIPNLVAFADALKAADLLTKAQAALAAGESAGDPDTIVRLSRIVQLLPYDFQFMVDKVEALRQPAPQLP